MAVDKAVKRMQARVAASRRREDPAYLLKEQARARASRLARQARDPEAFRKHHDEKCKRKLARQKAKDPVGYALKFRIRTDRCKDRRKLLDPVSLQEWEKQKSDRKRRRISRAREQVAGSLLARINASIPRGLPLDVRQDIASEIYLSVLEDSTLAADVCAVVKKFITAHYRMFDGYKTFSIDDVIPGTDGLRRIDFIASDDPHF